MLLPFLHCWEARFVNLNLQLGGTTSSRNTLIKLRNALDSSECEIVIMNTVTSLDKGSVTLS